MDKALEQLRQHEKDVWARNRERRQAEEHVAETKKQEEQWAQDAEDLKAWRKAQEDLVMKPSTCSCQKQTSWVTQIASYAYTAYTWFFHCRRAVIKALFQEDEARKTLSIEIPLPAHPWMYISATVDENEYDVTDIVNKIVTPGERITSEWLYKNVDVPNGTPETITWEYIDSMTFELHKIPSDGLVNEVKSKTD